MSNMQSPFALAIADLHLSMTKPACRAEDNWLKVQAGYLSQVREIQNRFKVPLLCAGDIFDKWNPVPELIYFALKELPDDMYCVPGQHDLPNHRFDLMSRSGYGVLQKAKKIRCVATHTNSEVPARQHLWLGNRALYGFGWEQDITFPMQSEEYQTIALVHKYVWTKGKGFPGAPEEAKLPALRKQLKGYQWAIFGDNHKAFSERMLWDNPWTQVINCGPLIRRKVDEISHHPCVYGLMENGGFNKYPLDILNDKFLYTEASEAAAAELDMSDFVERLENLGEVGMDFRQIIQQNLKSNKLTNAIREIILAALE